MSGKLVLCGTPIGNLEDLSPRALRTIEQADVLACEDVRRTRKLLTHFGIKPKEIVVCNEGNERRQVPTLLRAVKSGKIVVLVSDAGMPGLSDPGYRVVQASAAAGLDIEVVPGPSAAIAALVASGLPTDRFVFEGFLPRKHGDRLRRLEALRTDERTVVVYISPHHLEDHLEDLLEVLGDRPAALARELTKIHEELRRATLSELLAVARSDPPRGEIVVVVSGAAPGRIEIEPEELARRARTLMDSGIDRREALAQVARDHGVPRRRVFDALVAVRED